jgi:hypothetical protein
MIKSILLLISGVLIGAWLTVNLYYRAQLMNDPETDFEEFLEMTFELIEDIIRGE